MKATSLFQMCWIGPVLDREAIYSKYVFQLKICLHFDNQVSGLDMLSATSARFRMSVQKIDNCIFIWAGLVFILGKRLLENADGAFIRLAGSIGAIPYKMIS
jgi:hypothetical protein